MNTASDLHRKQALGATARWTAAVRARESLRENPLFCDPWAAALAGPEGMAWVEQRSEESVLPIALRTRFFDDFLQRTVISNNIQQIVLVAAGLDTRAFRLSWPPDTRLFELDQEHVFAHKESVLSLVGACPACDRHLVAMDLALPWEERLVGAGFDVGQPSAWLLEGFLFYLPTAQLADILDRSLRFPVTRSFIGFDAINALTLTSPFTRNWVKMQAEEGAPWLGSLDNPQTFLAERGWQAALVAPGSAEASYGRWSLPVIPAAMPNMPHLWFVTGKKVIG